MLEILRFVLGPVATNCYLVSDTTAGEAVVIDPAWDGDGIARQANEHGWKISMLWITHAHFDHFAGAAGLMKAVRSAEVSTSDREPETGKPRVALHSLDRDLWEKRGGASLFGFLVDPPPEPTVDLAITPRLHLGAYEFQVLHTPGHTPGHVSFYCAQEAVLFSGDLIFRRGVGRTDLPGGDWQALEQSIRSKIYALPEETRILAGHGEDTRVGEEKHLNPLISI